LAKTRVLVALSEEYRAYEDAIASALRALRPQDEVATARLDRLLERIDALEPDLVMCGIPDPGRTPAWVELSTDPGKPTRIRVGTRTSETTNPDLSLLLSLVEEAGRLPDIGAAREDAAG
jgi:hypothetical protein